MISEVYECEGCDAVFIGSPEEAFDLGWDTPERFMSHCTCPNCPITSTAWWRIVVLKEAPSQADVEKISHYNRLYNKANPSAGATHEE
jgi:hypothetical protein